MDQCDDRDDRVLPCKTSLGGGHEDQRKRPGPEPSSVSFKSDGSKDLGITFTYDQPSAAKRVEQQNSEVPSGPSAQQHQTQLDSIFMLLEENIVTFVKNELRKMQRVLSGDSPEPLQREDEEVLKGADEKDMRSCKEAFEKIILKFLRRMKQDKLAEQLKS
ncbi:hypothetical protein ATANTOWER_019871, partial [Ataeniobius toweri]|nr:hypothetical protein [Ataeniobius toweri]